MIATRWGRVGISKDNALPARRRACSKASAAKNRLLQPQMSSFESLRPDLAIIVTGTLGLALGLVAAILWPVGLIVTHRRCTLLSIRGSRTSAFYYLITEAECSGYMVAIQEVTKR